MPPRRDPNEIRGFSGVDNVTPESSLPPGALRIAQNVDIGDDRRARRRAGYTQVIETPATHSLWSDPELPHGFYQSDGTLYRLGPDIEPEAILTGVSKVQEITYERVNDWVFWSDQQRIGRIGIDGSAIEVAPENPGGQPAVSAQAGIGGMDPGVYQVAITFRDVRGMESGAARAAVLEVPAGGGINLTVIPQPVSDNISAIRVYCTGAGDDIFRWRADLVVGTTSYLLPRLNPGRPLNTMFLEPMPPCRFLRRLNGRLLGARGRDLLIGEALRFGQWHPVNGYVRFPAEIDMIACLSEAGEGTGIYVACADRTYWLPGADPRETAPQLRYQAGVVPGTALMVPASFFADEEAKQPIAETTLVPYWLTKTGVFCLGLPGGQIRPIRENLTAADLAESGASILRELGGYRHVLTALRGAHGKPGLQIGDTVTSVVNRNGLTIA